ncbi:PREDICTED: mucolipin-3-like [Priapulus caudatus]|uniref:Mucolipin-3-like n=1 Tax=Priapulus caudatus TaxID=37621 RepID=A0ABM1E7V9_PRICU|nr:PREDICTED: mucolipin-3-like [Priapulus caudatus]
MTSESDDEMDSIVGRAFAGTESNVGSCEGATPTRLFSVNSSCESLHAEECLRRRLKFHFLDPLDKWRARHRCPWKLIVQLLKLVVVTAQLIQFVNARYSYADFVTGNMIAFEHLFLRGWDAARETNAYPPSTGAYALYEVDEFYEHLDHAVTRYHAVEHISIGMYAYANATGAATFCQTSYAGHAARGGRRWPHETACVAVLPWDTINKTFTFSSREFLAAANVSIDFSYLVSATLSLRLTAVHLKTASPYEMPDCFEFDIEILYDNVAHNGQLPVSLTTSQQRRDCTGDDAAADDDDVVTAADDEGDGADLTKTKAALVLLLNIIVVVICIASAVLCLRSIVLALQLRRETAAFFREHFGRELSPSDRAAFVNLWYVMIVVNDVLIVVGTVIRMQIDYKRSDSYDGCSIMLGTGNLLGWVGLLRYLKFFPKYNVLILTLRRALPNVLRFLACGLLMYCGFTLCGWAVLGPHHRKFASVSVTAECLFALINGDDMFATFAAASSTHAGTLVSTFARLYLYVFISLFIYVVLSLVLAIILDSYETIKEYYENGWPKSDLSEFIDRCTDAPSSGVFREHCNSWWMKYCTCRRARSTGSSTERSPLLPPPP